MTFLHSESDILETLSVPVVSHMYGSKTDFNILWSRILIVVGETFSSLNCLLLVKRKDFLSKMSSVQRV